MQILQNAKNAAGFTVVEHCVPYDKLWVSERKLLDTIRQLVFYPIMLKAAEVSPRVFVQARRSRLKTPY